MAKRRRILAALSLAAFFIAGAWFAAVAWREWRQTEQTDTYVHEIVARLDLKSMPGFRQRLDTVRGFINTNSLRKMDRQFWANHGNPAAFAGGVLAHAKGEAPPVHMECSTRANLMRQILEALGYRTRTVAVFNSRSKLQSHSFLEVMNPETGKWETQDPDFDIYWRSKISGERVSLAEEAESLEAIEPCGGKTCGWEQASREGMRPAILRPYLDIVTVTEKASGTRYALYTSRADLARAYSKDGKRGSFCEVQAKRCKQGFYDLRKYTSYAPGRPR